MVYNEDMGKARTLLLLISLLALLAGGSAFSQEKGSIVVFPFTGGGLSEAELRSLTIVLEESLSRFDSLQVIDQSKREKIIKDTKLLIDRYAGSDENECEISPVDQEK